MHDIHSHVLPGIDDGARTVADAVELCRIARAEGVRTLVATPHIREGVWANRLDGIVERLESLRAELARREVDVEVVLGAEVFFASEALDAVREGVFPTYGGRRRHILLELPTYFIPRQVQQLCFEFRTAGITPVIAHPERNGHLMGNLEVVQDLVRMGALLQVTAMSLTGRFGRSARKAAVLLQERGLVHAVASDGHHPQFRPTALRAAYAQVVSSWGEEQARRLFVENPRRIVAGEDVEAGLPAPARPRRGLRDLLQRVLGT